MFSGWSLSSTSGGSSGGGSYLSPTAPAGSGGSSGSWLAPTVPSTSQTSESYYSGGSVSYPASGGLSYAALPGAGLFAGPFGEGGAYTPLDFPLMHELRPGQRLEDLNVQSGTAGRSLLPVLALGLLATLLLKGK